MTSARTGTLSSSLTDKGNVTVVMDRKEYTKKLECMLEDGMYSKLRKDPTSSIESKH